MNVNNEHQALQSLPPWMDLSNKPAFHDNEKSSLARSALYGAVSIGLLGHLHTSDHKLDGVPGTCHVKLSARGT